MSEGQDIALRVQHVIEQIPDEARRLGIDTNGAWTLLIKERLAQLGGALNYEVYGSGAPPPETGQGSAPPWLYDMIWLRMVCRGRQMAGVPLVLESDWHSYQAEHIGADFQGLLLARADLHVMIFQQRKAKAVEGVMDQLEEQAKTDRPAHPAELYLLCGYDWEDTKRFAFRMFAA